MGACENEVACLHTDCWVVEHALWQSSLACWSNAMQISSCNFKKKPFSPITYLLVALFCVYYYFLRNYFDLRNSSYQQLFRYELLKVHDIPEEPPLHFSTGIRIANILHVRLRQKCSSIKCDLFRCNLIASCNCDCGNYIESVDQFFLACNI